MLLRISVTERWPSISLACSGCIPEYLTETTAEILCSAPLELALIEHVNLTRLFSPTVSIVKLNGTILRGRKKGARLTWLVVSFISSVTISSSGSDDPTARERKREKGGDKGKERKRHNRQWKRQESADVIPFFRHRWPTSTGGESVN